MYLSELTVRNFRQFGEGTAKLQICFQPGVTALVGRSDSGKSAVIDAIRYALLTRHQEFIRVHPEDFHIDGPGKQARQIYIVCKLSGLTDAEKGAFIEYLTYEDDVVVLYVTWTARKLSEAPSTRRWIDLSVRSGIDGAGPAFESSVRELLSAAYLRPLRDANVRCRLGAARAFRRSSQTCRKSVTARSSMSRTCRRMRTPWPGSAWSASGTTCATVSGDIQVSAVPRRRSTSSTSNRCRSMA